MADDLQGTHNEQSSSSSPASPALSVSHAYGSPKVVAWRRTRIFFAFFGYLLAIAASGVAWHFYDGVKQKEKEISQYRIDTNAVFEFALYEFAEKLRPLGKLSILDGFYAEIVKYYERQNDVLSSALLWFRQGELYQEQGRLDDALQLYKKSLQLYEDLATQFPDNLDWQKNITIVLQLLGSIHRTQGQRGDALRYQREAVKHSRTLIKKMPHDSSMLHVFATALTRKAELLYDQGRYAQAYELLQESVKTLRNVSHQEPEDESAQASLLASLQRLAWVLKKQNKSAEALLVYAEVIEELRKNVEKNPKNMERLYVLSIALYDLAQEYSLQKDYKEAIELFQENLKIYEKLTAYEAENKKWRRAYAINLYELADIFKAVGAEDDALELYDLSLAMQKFLAKANPTNRQIQESILNILNKSAKILYAQKKMGPALKRYEEQWQLFRELLTQNPQDVERQIKFVSFLILFPKDFFKDPKDILALYEEALEVAKGAMALYPNNIQLMVRRSYVLKLLADGYAQQGDEEKALSLYTESHAFYKKFIARMERGAVKENDARTIRVFLPLLEKTYRDLYLINEFFPMKKRHKVKMRLTANI